MKWFNPKVQLALVAMLALTTLLAIAGQQAFAAFGGPQRPGPAEITRVYNLPNEEQVTLVQPTNPGCAAGCNSLGWHFVLSETSVVTVTITPLANNGYPELRFEAAGEAFAGNRPSYKPFMMATAGTELQIAINPPAGGLFIWLSDRSGDTQDFKVRIEADSAARTASSIISTSSTRAGDLVECRAILNIVGESLLQTSVGPIPVNLFEVANGQKTITWEANMAGVGPSDFSDSCGLIVMDRTESDGNLPVVWYLESPKNMEQVFLPLMRR